jgi:Zn-dependent protease with chaperone function
VIAWLMIAPLIASILLGAGASALRRTLPPKLAATMLTALAVTTALATGLVLCVAAGLAYTQLSSVARGGGWSAAAIAGWQRIPTLVGVAAGLLAAGLGSAAAVHLLRVVRHLRQTSRACRFLGPEVAGLVVVDDERSGAFAVPGRRGRTVVTRGLLRQLDGPERRALLAHEAAHLRHRHVLHVQLTELASVANPLLRSVAHAVRLAVESWADEEAAGVVGDREIVSRTLAKAAFAKAGVATPAGALGASNASDLAVRVDTLLDGERHRRPLFATVVATAVAVAACCALVVASGAHEAFEHAEVVATAVAGHH